MRETSARRRKRIARIAQAYRDSQEVLSICISLGLFVGGGYWLDQRYGWKPWATILGVVLGFVAAAYSLRAFMVRMEKRNTKPNSPRREQSRENKEVDR